MRIFWKAKVVLLVLSFILFPTFFILKQLSLKETSAQTGLSGHLVANSSNPRWLFYDTNGDGVGDKPHFMCAPGDPEDFLYRGARNADGTRSGDQGSIINSLKSNLGNGKPANGIYMQIVRSHGGDGSADHNPFIDSNPSNGLDNDILNQWDTWFSDMDSAGIVIYLFFWDDSARITNWGNYSENQFYTDIVNRFEKYKNLVWVFAEEYQEKWSSQEVISRVQIIRGADNYKHPIAVHKLSGLSFSEFANDPNIDQFSIQYKVSGNDANHNAMIQAWNSASGKYNLNLSEPQNIVPSTANRTSFRQRNWAVAMGGAYIMNIEWTVSNTPPDHLKDCGRLVSFMESTNFHEMTPSDNLKAGSTQYVLAKPGDSYILYTAAYSSNVGLTSMTSGTYNFRWLDTVTGTVVEQNNVSVGSGTQTWTKPSGFGNELALYITKGTGGPTLPPATSTPTPPPGTKTPTPSVPNGDADGDGDRDISDYAIWLTNYNTNSSNGKSSGDFNGNGKIEGVDYMIWHNNYNGR